MFQRARAAACLLFASTIVSMIAVLPASAQGHTIRQGVLTCRTSASVGLVVGSRQRLACQFRSETGRTQRYVGTIGRLGLDLGVTAGGVMAWVVLASTPTIPSGALAGEFVGASGDIRLVSVLAPICWSEERESRFRCSHSRSRDKSASISRSAWRG
jgi:hypothetical protein